MATRTIVLVVLALLCATDARSDEPLTEERARRWVADVSPAVERLRGLAFERPVPVSLVDTATAREYMVSRLESFQAAGELSVVGRVYRLLGMIPGGLDLPELLLDLLAEQAGAYYDPESGGIYVMSDLLPLAAPIVVAHELTHAIDDQHYDLDARLHGADHDEDRAFALSAIHEGSATLLMEAFARERVASARSDEQEPGALDFAALAQAFPDVPAILARQLIGPYLLGAEFLADPSADGTSRFPAARVDRAYVAPPLSSEQILHPRKYWDPQARDDPRPLEIGDAGRRLGADWSRLGWGRLGELGLAVLVGAETPRDVGSSASYGERWTHPAAAGWDGDRWELWGRGARSVVLLCTIWDSAADAAEFADALPADRGIRHVVTDDRVALVAGDVGPKRARRLLARMRASCLPAPESVE